MKKPIILPLTDAPASVEVFSRIRKLAYPVFLDSSALHEQDASARFSIISAEPSELLIMDQKTLYRQKDKQKTLIKNLSLEQAQQQLLEKLAPIDAPHLPFSGGLIGFWSYELASRLNPTRLQRTCPLPVACLGLYLWAIIFDAKYAKTYIVAHPTFAKEKLADLQALLNVKTKNAIPTAKKKEELKIHSKFCCDMDKEKYATAFYKIKNYINAGDCYQINLTRRFFSTYTGDLWHAYCHIRKIKPTAYSAFIDFPNFTILCFSPERFLAIDNGKMISEPIKGTRPRGNTPIKDRKLAQELLQSEKERAENLMIVDLLRNDLGKHAKTGTIAVPNIFEVRSYSNVHHLVSTITGEMKTSSNPSEVFLNAFPGGSITGAPKIRAMEIIEELEPSARTIYCGSIGYISSNGRMNSNIVIRSLLGFNNNLWCWSGGAIVADSELEAEYQESITKVQMLVDALGFFGKNL